jgi:arylsulfatase A-like enzyme
MMATMHRRKFLQTLPLYGLSSRLAQSASRPNFVFILADDMGYADVEPYGARDIRTPHLKRLAGEGVRFTQCYANGPVCTPTRAGFITGRWQQRVGLEWALVPGDKGKGLPATEPTIARSMKEAGYRTAIIGKWHLGMEPEYNPTRHGFDYFFGITSGNVDMYSHKYRTGLDDLWENSERVRREGYLTDLIGDRAARFIDENRASPFFLYVPFNAVHWPFQAPGRPQDVRNEKTWTDGTRAGDYAPMTESLDANIGKLLAALDRNGLAGNTLVIFTNDNGGERLSDNRPLFHHKATLWEGGIRVPALMRWRGGGVPAGRQVQQVAITMDFTATILSAAGLQVSRELDGIDLLPAVRGDSAPVERTLYWRIERSDRRQRAVRYGPWKWIRDGSIEMLFDLERDVGERHDLAYSHPAVAARLRGLYDAWESEIAREPPPFVVK